MKTSKYQVLKTIALCVVLLAAARTGKAQVFPNSYINVDWQVGVPLGSSLADKASGWGMNFEGGYFITPAIAVGPFISYQTNSKRSRARHSTWATVRPSRSTRSTPYSSCRSASPAVTPGLRTAYSSLMRA